MAARSVSSAYEASRRTPLMKKVGVPRAGRARQPEVGFAAIPGGHPASRLPRLVGRGRAFEILLGGEDFDGEFAEQYGYVNLGSPDDEFENFGDRCRRRASNFDRQALAIIQHFVQ